MTFQLAIYLQCLLNTMCPANSKLTFISTIWIINWQSRIIHKFRMNNSNDSIRTFLDALQLLHYFVGVDFNEEGEILTQKGLKICTYQIQELVLGALNQAVANKLLESIDILRESYTGTSTFCELIHGHLLVNEARRPYKLRIGMGFNLVIYMGTHHHYIDILIE